MIEPPLKDCDRCDGTGVHKKTRTICSCPAGRVICMVALPRQSPEKVRQR